MRILISNEHLGLRGGVETYLATILPVLATRGHTLGLLHANEPAPGERALTDELPGIERFTTGPGAIERVAAWNPDVVFDHGVADVALDSALVDRHPTAFLAHAYGGACVSGTKRFAFPAIELCRRALGPGCLARYHVRRCGGLNPMTLLADYRVQTERRALLDRYAVLLVLSRHMKDEFERQGVSPSRISVLPFPARGARDPAPTPRPFSNGILFVGRLTALKGVSELVEAVALASRALGRRLELRIAGEGPERLRVEMLARRLSVPLELSGWVDAERRDALMRGADVLAVPSLWPEPLGLVGLEAGALGLPAVAFAVGGIPEWCQAGVSGELAPGDRPTAGGLAEALVRALKEPEHLQRLRSGAWEMARRHALGSHIDALETSLGSAAATRKHS